jgi:hypothetical protein
LPTDRLTILKQTYKYKKCCNKKSPQNVLAFNKNETLFRATGIRYICDSEDPFGPKKKERTANTRQKTKLLK